MIIDPIAIKFVNEEVRPLAEAARALRARIASATTEWFGGTNALFPNDSTPLNDGRDAEGISRLTGSDVNSLMGIIIAMNGAGNDEIIAKPCVRPIIAS